MKELEKLGFELAGEWRVEKGKLRTHLCKERNAGRGIVYAFVSDNKLKYIGETERRLKDRMGNIQGNKEDWAKKLQQQIKKALPVSIYAVQVDKVPMRMTVKAKNPASQKVKDSSLKKEHWAKVESNAIRRIWEEMLILHFDPPWNKKGKSKG